MNEIKKGIYLHTQDEIIEDQKTWDVDDKAKEIDFTTSNFWITAGECEPTGYDTEAEAMECFN